MSPTQSQDKSPGPLVRIIQRSISFLAPPLHSLHWKIFALCLAAIFLPGIFFAWKVGQGIERSHLRSTEEGMIDTALVIAEAWPNPPQGNLRIARETLRRVFKNPAPNLRMVLLSPEGLVQHDSEGKYFPGEDRSADRDVRKAMTGEYGARWERDAYRRVVILFATVPIMKHGVLVGMVSVIKTTADVRKSVIRSLKDLILPAILALFLASLVSFALSTYLTGNLKSLGSRAERVAAGERGVQLETWSRSELGTLARALEKMRKRLEGKKYVEDMALTLSHEIKTPIAAIRGAAEIVDQTEDASVRKKFIGNILSESDRLAAIVSNFLALSRIENLPSDPTARASLPEVASLAAAAFLSRSGEKTFDVQISRDPCMLALPADQLQRMMEAVLENAFQFTPPGGRVVFSTAPDGFSVTDSGPGIPADLRKKVFDRFFTTVNPLTGRRGTGLGLSIVKSLADRYRAKIRLTSGEGTTVAVDFTPIS